MPKYNKTIGANTSPKTTQTLLDKYNKVENHIDNPKFIPYNKNADENGNTVGEIEVSPLVDFMYYHKLPEVYRTFDLPLGKPLYRYLQSLFNSGYAALVNKFLFNEEHSPKNSEKESLGGIENLIELLDPEKCPNKFLPYFCESMGIQWFPDLAKVNAKALQYNDYYNRTFLSNIGEIYKRRGTEAVVKYIAKVLTEMDVILKYERVFDRDMIGKTNARILWVELQAKTEEQINNVGINAEIIKRYIDTQLPYYITTAVLYVISKLAKASLYTGNFVISTVHKAIIPRPQKETIRLFYTSDAEPFKTSDNKSIKC